jgi:thiamine monophosphate kinase
MLAGAATGCIQSAIDTSDGFLSCLEILGRDSKVGFILEESLIEDIIDDNVKQIAAALGLRPAQFLFNAGHDWEIVLTTNRNQFEELRDVIRRTGGDLSRLGRVCDLDELSFTDSSVARPLETGIALVSSNTKEKFWIPFFTDEKFVQRAYEDRPTEWIDLKPYLEGSKPLR